MTVTLTDIDRRALVEEHAELVYGLARAFKHRAGRLVEYDDLVGDGMVGLVEAARTFDPALGAFGPRARVFVRREMIEGQRRQRRQGRRNGVRVWRQPVRSLDEPVANHGAVLLQDVVPDPRQDPVRQVLGRERLAELSLALPSETLAQRRARLLEGREGAWLTAPELDVLRAAADGLTDAESAALLKKGIETVKTQRRSVIAKLGARRITNAVFIAAREGII